MLIKGFKIQKNSNILKGIPNNTFLTERKLVISYTLLNIKYPSSTT